MRMDAANNEDLEPVFTAIYMKLKDQGILASTRRFHDLLKLSAGRALLAGRTKIETPDFMAFIPGLWTKPEQYAKVRQEIGNLCLAATSEMVGYKNRLDEIENEYRTTKPSEISKRAALTTKAVVIQSEIEEKGPEWSELQDRVAKLIESFVGFKLDH